MDNRPIGVFDSGLGGLTAVRELKDVMPNEDIIYLGDTGRVPYGSRSKETIIKYARQDIAFLQSFDIKAVVAACGTVSAAALPEITDDYAISIYGVVDASARKAVEVTRNGRVGLIGTEASIKSGAYEKKMMKLAPEIKIFGKACPLFVPLVENGRVSVGDIVVESVAREYLDELKNLDIDTLVLGCTHYPLLSDVIGQFMGPDVTLICPGSEVAKHVSRRLDEEGMLSEREEIGQHRYFVTDAVNGFSQMASLYLEEDVRGSVIQVSLDGF